MALKVEKNNTIKKFVSKEELNVIQGMNAEFQKIKMSLGDIEMEKHELLKKLDTLREHFAIHEKDMVAKYGADSVINIQTGEVTEKDIELIK